MAFGQLGVAFLEGPQEHVAALAVGGAPGAGLLGVHPLVDQAHGLGHVLAFLGEQDGPIGGGDGEPAAVFAEGLGGRRDDRGGGVGVHRGQDAELIPTEPVGAAAVVGHGLLQGLGQPDEQGVAGGVAEAVVVALEAVEVEQHQQQRLRWAGLL